MAADKSSVVSRQSSVGLDGTETSRFAPATRRAPIRANEPSRHRTIGRSAGARRSRGLLTTDDWRLTTDSGFTLLEVMVALAILGLGLTAILSAQAGLYGANVQARNLTQATSAARCKMEELEMELLTKGYPETDQADEGPCCAGESPPGMTCRWNVERVVLPDPPAPSLTDGGTSGGDGGTGGLGALGALAGAAGNPASLGDGGLSGLASTLASQPGPNGQTGAAGVAGMAMNIVYPQLKPLLEASIRRVTLDAVWNEGPIERKVHLVQFVTNPQKGLPPFVPGAGSAGAPGAPGGTVSPIGGIPGLSPGGGFAPAPTAINR